MNTPRHTACPLVIAHVAVVAAIDGLSYYGVSGRIVSPGSSPLGRHGLQRLERLALADRGGGDGGANLDLTVGFEVCAGAVARFAPDEGHFGARSGVVGIEDAERAPARTTV